MQKDRAKRLKVLIDKIAADFSRQDRAHNRGETFTYIKHRVINDDCAALLYQKEPSNKFALVYAYWVGSGDGSWRYFFPKYNHIAGMAEFAELLKKVEETNWDKNFMEEGATTP